MDDRILPWDGFTSGSRYSGQRPDTIRRRLMRVAPTVQTQETSWAPLTVAGTSTRR